MKDVLMDIYNVMKINLLVLFFVSIMEVLETKNLYPKTKA